MKSIKKIFGNVITVIVMTLVLCACNVAEETEETTTAILNHYYCSGTTSYELDKAGDYEDCRWESSSPKDAPVDECGNVKVFEPGSYTITAVAANDAVAHTWEIKCDKAGYDYVSQNELEKSIKDGEKHLLIIDLRTADQFSQGSIPGAVNATTLTEVPWDPTNAGPCFLSDEEGAKNLKAVFDKIDINSSWRIVFCCPGGGGGAENAIRLVREKELLGKFRKCQTEGGHLYILEDGLMQWFENHK